MILALGNKRLLTWTIYNFKNYTITVLKDKNANYFRISMDDGYDYIITSVDSDIKGYSHINFSLIGKTIENNNPKFTYDTKSGFKQLK